MSISNKRYHVVVMNIIKNGDPTTLRLVVRIFCSSLRVPEADIASGTRVVKARTM